MEWEAWLNIGFDTKHPCYQLQQTPEETWRRDGWNVTKRDKITTVLYTHMQMHVEHNDTIKTSDTVLRKYISLTLFERVVCQRELETEQNCNILTPTLMAISVSFQFSLAAQPGAWGPSLSGYCSSIQHLISNSSDPQLRLHNWGPTLKDAGFLYRILSPTDWISWALSYIIVQRPPSSCGRHKLHSFNPSTVKVILCYSSTGCTCYLHRCITYFDSPAGS